MTVFLLVALLVLVVAAAALLWRQTAALQAKVDAEIVGRERSDQEIRSMVARQGRRLKDHITSGS